MLCKCWVGHKYDFGDKIAYLKFWSKIQQIWDVFMNF